MSELDHMDALAAEYVLGSLDVEERAQARNLLEADPTFAAKVELWERRFGELHLMVEPVDRIVPDFAKAGANIISFHPEASRHIDRTIGLIKEQGCKAGLVFNPATPLYYLDHVLDKLDLVLIMSVNPGFGGQKFIPEALEKLKAVRKRIDATGKDIMLEIDGGVKVDNIAEIARAGADTFVAGSAIYGAGKDSDPHRYDSVVAALRAELAKA